MFLWNNIDLKALKTAENLLKIKYLLMFFPSKMVSRDLIYELKAYLVLVLEYTVLFIFYFN